jgi:hypothetical protein
MLSNIGRFHCLCDFVNIQCDYIYKRKVDSNFTAIWNSTFLQNGGKGRMKKVLYIIIAILVLMVTFFCGVLVNQNTYNSLVKQTEEVTQQATTTSSDTAYITTVDHLEELNSVKSEITADKIASGETIAGVTGTYKGQTYYFRGTITYGSWVEVNIGYRPKVVVGSWIGESGTDAVLIYNECYSSSTFFEYYVRCGC